MTSLAECHGTNSVYIVGGGPSLKDVDLSNILKDKATIGCNRSAFDAGTKILFSIDRTFMNCFRHDILNFKGQVVLAPRKWDDHDLWPNGLRRYVWQRDSRLSKEPPYIQGLHTGQGALNLAVLEGFTEIHLLGIDLNRQGHWHVGYGGAQSMSVMQRWAYDMDCLKPDLDALGVRVFNYSLDSAVRAYQFRNIEEIT